MKQRKQEINVGIYSTQELVNAVEVGLIAGLTSARVRARVNFNVYSIGLRRDLRLVALARHKATLEIQFKSERRALRRKL